MLLDQLVATNYSYEVSSFLSSRKRAWLHTWASGDGVQDRHEHLSGGQGPVSSYQAVCMALGGVLEADRRKGHQGHVTEP